MGSRHSVNSSGERKVQETNPDFTVLDSTSDLSLPCWTLTWVGFSAMCAPRFLHGLTGLFHGLARYQYSHHAVSVRRFQYQYRPDASTAKPGLTHEKFMHMQTFSVGPRHHARSGCRCRKRSGNKSWFYRTGLLDTNSSVIFLNSAMCAPCLKYE